MDLTIFQGKFGQSAPVCSVNAAACGSTIPPPIVGDLNGDGVVNTIDLTMYLSRFGHACLQPPNCSGGNQFYMPGGPTAGIRRTGAGPGVTPGEGGAATHSAAVSPPGPVIAALGFTSAEAFQSFVDTLSDAELKVYLVLVLQVAQSLEAPTP